MLRIARTTVSNGAVIAKIFAHMEGKYYLQTQVDNVLNHSESYVVARFVLDHVLVTKIKNWLVDVYSKLLPRNREEINTILTRF